MSQIRKVQKVATFVVPEVFQKLNALADAKGVTLYRLAADLLEDATFNVKLKPRAVKPSKKR